MKLLLAPLSGAVFCLGFAPFNIWPAALVGVAGLFYLLVSQTRHPLLVAWLFGVGKYGLGASWIYVSIHVYGNAPPLLAGSMVVLFTAFTALLFCLPLGWAYHQLRPAQPGWRAAVLFVALWSLAEWSTTWLLTGFPWLLSGNAMITTWLGAWVPVFGVLGTGFGVALSAAFAVLALLQRDWRHAGVALLPWLVGALLGTVTWVQPVSRHTVALVQGNLDQSIKWQRDQVQANLDRHLQLSADHWDVELLIWPEAAITMIQSQAQQALEQISRQGVATGTAVLLGIPGVERVGDNYEFKNLAIGAGLARGRFAKHHLVPFGEYVPLAGLLRGLIDFFDLPMSSNTPGAARQANITTPFGEVAMAICYEVAYPDSLRRQAASAGLLVTLSNDTWFGRSIGPLQHMQIAQMRALETGRWLLRATNNGVTGIVDHHGVVVASLPQFRAATLRGDFQVMQGTTPYVWWGHGPLLLVIAGILGVRVWPKFGGQNDA